MVYRIFSEKKEALANEANALLSDIRHMLGIHSVSKVRVIHRYDAEGLDQELFSYAVHTVFSEPQLDQVWEELDVDGATAFAVEYLPGQFDQRADSAAQCIQFISQGERPLIRTATVYLLYGEISAGEREKIQKFVINPVESRLASMDKPETLKIAYGVPTKVDVLDGFEDMDEKALREFLNRYGLAMDLDDLMFCQKYFAGLHRDPTITEIRIIDTYWSDHCRHTTFLTNIDSVTFEDRLLQGVWEEYQSVRKELGRTKPVCLMDLATIATRYLKEKGLLDQLDESEEINACTVKIKVHVEGKPEDWLLLFKNETHNHPTEIEPFGGAATCIGGAIRDPLSGRSYVYGAMRVTGAADPLKHFADTMEGKLPQKKLVTTAAHGYSSYGNQIGLATGIVDELYHPGYAAKHLEIGAVIGAAPAINVRRERPIPGDVIILLGGSTGRDGCGGATGSSKSHTLESLETCGAEVQKGNAPEERKLQRLFRNPKACRMIKRCNDFGAGGVSVAIGELADGLDINLDAVPKKYEGLDGTELAISESQERMAVVVAPEDAAGFLALADQENLQAAQVATVKDEPRMTLSWKGQVIANLDRSFLDSNGAEKHIAIKAGKAETGEKEPVTNFVTGYEALAQDLNICSKRGLSEQFDSTIGAGTVLMPFGGKYQLTPIQAMAQKVSVEQGHTDTCSLMAWGYNPYLTETSPYHGAYLAVVESVCKLIATGASFEEVYLTLQEYFPSPRRDSERWGMPLAAMLGAFKAQIDLKIAAIGGKDSMSGSFEELDVPPTLVSFAVTVEPQKHILSPELKEAGHKLIWIAPQYTEEHLPDIRSLRKVFDRVTGLIREGKCVACYTPGFGGIAEAVMKMAFGNGMGVQLEEGLELSTLFGYQYGGFVLETTEEILGETLLGQVTDDGQICYRGETLDLSRLLKLYEGKLEPVYHCNISQESTKIPTWTCEPSDSWTAQVKCMKPRVLIPVFPGTNCEYDSAKAVAAAGAEPKIFVINNRTPNQIADSIQAFAKELSCAQMLFVPGGFSGGDEPEGSGKFITAFFRNGVISQEIMKLLDDREGLICGICNGFQALIKLGLVPYGKILDTDVHCPTLTYNTIGRHQSRMVRTRVVSNQSPWLSLTKPGEIYSVPVSHGEGRFFAEEEMIRDLAAKGQIATQYVDLDGKATSDIHFNPNDSLCAIEGITSPDGRVFGKMGHAERIDAGLYQNVQGNYDIHMFEGAVKYFR